MFLYYNFPSAEDSDGEEFDYWEVWLTLGHGFDTTLSPYVSLLATYSPDWTLEDGDAYYLKGSLALSLSDNWGLDFAYGYQDVDGDETTPDGFSYSHVEVGLTTSGLGFDFDLRYHDTDDDDDFEEYIGADEIIDDRIVFSISRSF